MLEQLGISKETLDFIKEEENKLSSIFRKTSVNLFSSSLIKSNVSFER